jgi:hypothetical protein
MTANGGGQQPTESQPQRYDISGGEGAQDNHDGVGCYLIVRVIELSDGKKVGKKYTMALGSRQKQIKAQQPSKNMPAQQERDETWGATAGEQGRSAIWSF